MQEPKENTALKMYGKECTLKCEDFIKKFKIRKEGLSSQTAEELLHTFGYNEVKQGNLRNGIIIFLVVYLVLLIVF